MSINSKKICFSLVLAAAAGMVQAVNSSCLLADAGFVAVQDNTASAGNYTSNRPKEKQRLFRSTAVEKEIVRVQKLLKNRKLSWMFANCFPNTLDTTVHFRKGSDGKPDTFVYTGDIHAMWLRDWALWPCRIIRHLPVTIPLTVLKRNNDFSVPLPWRKRLSVYRNF